MVISLSGAEVDNICLYRHHRNATEPRGQAGESFGSFRLFPQCATASVVRESPTSHSLDSVSDARFCSQITRMGRIRMKELDFLPGLDWIFSWIGETTINQRRAELVGPLEEAGRRVFQKALGTVTQDKIAEFIAERTNRFRMLG